MSISFSLCHAELTGASRPGIRKRRCCTTGKRFHHNRCATLAQGLTRFLSLEPLEERRLLAIAEWDGGPSGTGTDWHSAENWVADALPAAEDDVEAPRRIAGNAGFGSRKRSGIVYSRHASSHWMKS